MSKVIDDKLDKRNILEAQEARRVQLNSRRTDYENMTTDELAAEMTDKQLNFAVAYLESGNATQAAKEAGYKGNLSRRGAVLKGDDKIYWYLMKMNEEKRSKKIANSQEIMEYLTSVMRGEVKDQFGLDAPLSERTRAAQELAKRTIDVEQKMEEMKAGVQTIELKLVRYAQ